MKKDINKIWVPFLRVHSRVTARLEKELCLKFDISLSVYDVLIQLRLAKGELELTELARRLLISNSGVTRLLDRMERKGWVTRVRSTVDRRKVSAQLTEAGLDLERRATQIHFKGIETHFLSVLDDQDKNAMASALKKLQEYHS